MTSKYIHASILPPRRVQILKADSAAGYWKPGQFGYAVAYSTHPGMHTLDKGPSEPDEMSYLVAKSKDHRGGALWFSAQGLRFTGKEKIPSPSHARKKKLSHEEARRLLTAEGIDFSRDYHESVSMSQGNRIAEVAKQAGYRKAKNAPGSTARMYFQRLSRLKGHATRKHRKHTIYDLVEVNTRAKKERVLHQHFSTKSDAKEAQDEYKALKKPGLRYQIRSRQIAAPAYRWNPED
jgi:hypothetical protein